jgi:hypothetical protein
MAYGPRENWSLGPIQWSKDKETADRYHDYLTELREHMDKGIGMAGLPMGKFRIHIGDVSQVHWKPADAQNSEGTIACSMCEDFGAPTSIGWPDFHNPINKLHNETIFPVFMRLTSELQVPMSAFNIWEYYYKEENKSRMMAQVDIKNRVDQATADELVQRGTKALRDLGLKDIYVKLTVRMVRQWS